MPATRSSAARRPAPGCRRRGLWLAAALAAALGARPGAAAEPDVGPPRCLAAGEALEATLSWGEVHRYVIELTRGDYVVVALDQRSIDILPVITAPDGAVLFRNNGNDWGREEAAIVAPVTGLYRLDLSPARRGAATGTYGVRVETVRPATADDAARARALGLMSEAYTVYSPMIAATGTTSKVDLPRARALYEQALAAYQALEDRRGEAAALYALGDVANNMDDYHAQADFMRRSAEVARAAGDEYLEACALRARGKALDLCGEYEEAGALYDRGLALYRATGNV
ncbi:MAG TPA: hypothetical protein VMQ62_00870, partial [Dongiaceae bacterium]|nr:hypothetical protein [Dongiaceae bacterium]